MGLNNKKQIITDNAPSAVGAYSQAVSCNGFLFISGQIPIDPETGETLTGTVEAQTKQVLTNIKGILSAAGLSFEDIVKAEIFLSDINDFSAMNEVYETEINCSIKPARSVVEVANIPKGAGIEISCIAAQ